MSVGRRGRFISFEGGDGVGKSTQVRRLAEHLRAKGVVVHLTREPGGSDGAEAIRKLLVEGSAERWSPLAEALMMYAGRADHLERVIRPALARGETVITDRFADSTMAYQGVAGGVGRATIDALHRHVVGADDPDLTFILDAPTEVGLRRAAARADAPARFESKGRDFQQRVRRAFLDIARDNPSRCIVVDTTRDEDAVFRVIAEAVDRRREDDQ